MAGWALKQRVTLIIEVVDMQCIKCGHNTQVLETRPKPKSIKLDCAAIKRRRKCIVCHYRFNTLEITQEYFKENIGRRL